MKNRHSEGKVIILGAGPVGLVTAWKMLESGRRVDIYEKESAAGGLCRTWNWGDFLVDTGPHIFHTPDKELAGIWEKEFGDLLIKGDFYSKNVTGEDFSQLWDYPLSWESISRYPQQLKKKILRELEGAAPEKKANACNYAEYIEAQVGPTLAKKFFDRYPRKLWGIPVEKMSAEWAPKRIEFRQEYTPFYHNQWNAVGKFGTGCIFERIKDKILELGGNINTGFTVNRLGRTSKTITEIGFTNGRKIKVEPQDTVISSLPLTILARLLGFETKLYFRGVRTVYLAYKKDTLLPDGVNWIYYDSDKVYFTRITEPKKMSGFVAPKGKTYLTAEISISPGDSIDKMNEAQLVKKVAAQVELVGLAEKTDLLTASAHTEYFVYPVHYVGYQDDLAKARAAVSKYEQLYSLGTGGEFNYADIQILFLKAFDTAAMFCSKASLHTQVIREASGEDMASHIKIGGRLIGKGERAYIIAEAGLNHNGSLGMAKKLIDAAKDAGADAIKFQTYKPGARVSKKVKAARYAEEAVGMEEDIADMFDRLAMDFTRQKELFSYAKKKGIEIFSTPFDMESADFLNSMGVKLFKIASVDLVNLPLLRHVARFGKPLLISTGMANFGQIEEAVDAVTRAGNTQIMLLHCNSSYPAAAEEMNLNVMASLRNYFKVPVGLSDHTVGLFVSQVALTLDAELIERHFTLDKMLEGPDHMLSSDPAELRQLVELSKTIPLVLGNGKKVIQPNEYNTLNTQRKCLYAAVNIRAGQKIAPKMIAVKGPGGGLLPKYMDIVVGRQAKKDIKEDHPITWDVI